MGTKSFSLGTCHRGSVAGCAHARPRPTHLCRNRDRRARCEPRRPAAHLLWRERPLHVSGSVSVPARHRSWRLGRKAEPKPARAGPRLLNSCRPTQGQNVLSKPAGSQRAPRVADTPASLETGPTVVTGLARGSLRRQQVDARNRAQAENHGSGGFCRLKQYSFRPNHTDKCIY